mgnify:FL=1
MENLNYTNDAVMLLKDLIAIPSISRNEEKAADKLAEYLNLWHLPFGREGNNLWVGCPDWDNNRPTVMLNAHIDTVKPVSSWTRDPFQPMQEGDMLYGLGANDCGGGLVSLLQTYRIMLERPRNYNILWVASAEEEVSGENGFSRVMSKLPKIDVAIVGEPTGMQPAIAEKGLMVIDGYAHGKSGHAAREEGVNAIYEALEDLIWLRDYKFRKVSPLLGATKMTVTVVEGSLDRKSVV